MCFPFSVAVVGNTLPHREFCVCVILKCVFYSSSLKRNGICLYKRLGRDSVLLWDQSLLWFNLHAYNVVPYLSFMYFCIYLFCRFIAHLSTPQAGFCYFCSKMICKFQFTKWTWFLLDLFVNPGQLLNVLWRLLIAPVHAKSHCPPPPFPL